MAMLLPRLLSADSVVQFENGLDLIELSILAGALTVIFTFLGFCYTRFVKPVVKASKAFNQRWDDAGTIKEIKDQLAVVMAAVKPSNGDQRTLSDRLDDIKHSAAEATKVAEAARSDLAKYQRDEILERRERMRQADDHRISTNTRLSNMEKTQVDLNTRQTAMSQRQTRMELDLRKILEKLEIEGSN